MDYGMFGHEDYYYFYMEFQPPYDIATATYGFEIWFQMGDYESSWEGLTWTSPSGGISDGNQYILTGVQATNTNYVSSADDKYTDDTFFFGIIDYDTVPIVKIIR